ncbi:MAG: (2Fe-2S)-binding protein [Acidobacteria bacterium]|nr:(2Fe-2S)-binding protein [Acidobacteriota bacterium]
MSNTITFSIDGKEIECKAGRTILDAAEENGIYIPRLCHRKGVSPHGSCRVCTVIANGKPMAACTTPVTPGMVVENDAEEVTAMRKAIIEMLFVEGNHFCMFCEKSGNCELQALAYRFGIAAPRYPYLFPHREIDFGHPDVFIDHNRCILCARCIRTSREIDGKEVLGFVERGPRKKVAANAEHGLRETEIAVGDEAMAACPVGALMPKHVGYQVPIGKREFDHEPIGSDIEKEAKASTK